MIGVASTGLTLPGIILASTKKIRSGPNAMGVWPFVTSAVTNRGRFPRTLTDRDIIFEKEAREMSMRTIKLVVSDLHVASGDTMLDGFGERQQAALEGLLAAAGRSGVSPLGEADDVELILNGD